MSKVNLAWGGEKISGTGTTESSVVTEEGEVGGPGTGVVTGVGAGLQESSVTVPGVESGSAGASGYIAVEREVGARTGKESLLHFRIGATGDVGVYLDPNVFFCHRFRSINIESFFSAAMREEIGT